VPTFREWMNSKFQKHRVLVEPFAGGGIISLTALFENFVESAVMVELDEEIAAVWQSIVQGNAKWLAKRILDFNLTKESVIKELSKKPRSIKERAFHTILKNRTFHGGILAEGSGFLKYGENGKGIHSRWYPGTLARRLENLDMVSKRMDFRCSDGLKIIQEFTSVQDAAFFIDPPYTAGGKKAGKRLYRHCDLDHKKLFSLCEKLQGDFIITYDNADEVRAMAHSHGFQMRLVPMTNTHHATIEELVIGKSLFWMDKFPSVHEPESAYNVSKTVKNSSTKASGTSQKCHHRSQRPI